MAQDNQSTIAQRLRAQGYALVETHISQVFLGERDVYKLKRPVNLGFLDFSTLAARRAACEAELSLNRRLAPAVYLEVAGLVEHAGQLRFAPGDELHGQAVLEWAVHMQRLSEGERADVRLAGGGLTAQALADLAGLLVRFHAACRSDDETAAFGAPEQVAANVEENFAQTRALSADHVSAEQVAHIQRYQRVFLSQQADLLRERQRRGFVRDGHGDLRLEHVYRGAHGEHVIIDCIEFNERFRFADVCADLAFLSMDLRAHGRPDLAEQLVAAYARHSDDYQLYALLDFYESYRAFVRAKVASILAHDADVTPATRQRAHDDARRHFLLAVAAADPPLVPPRLIVCMGTIASGKSTLAGQLASRLGTPLLSSDQLRKQLAGVAPLTPMPERPFQGAYSSEASAGVYGALRERAEPVLRSRRSVILDASFRAASERREMLQLARSCAAEVLFLECRCPRETALQRLAERARGPHVSDGRSEVYDAFVAGFEPSHDLPAESHLVLDTSGAAEGTLAEALRQLM